jgi:Flp pilus assembly protein TadG
MNFRMKKSFEALGLRWSRTKERGATAVVIALCLTLLMGAAAMSFDVANLALQRQKLQNLTDAAAQAGAVYLRDNPKDLAGAKQAALNYAYTYDKSFKLADMTLYCIVPSNGAATNPDVAPGNIGILCDPLTNANKKCDQNVCAIVCDLPGAICNAIRVSKDENVDFYFAPAIGIPNGSTGAVASISCAKSCGSGGTPNPLDIAIIADRTPSMSDTDFNAMKAGIEGGIALMTPEYQLVTFGAIHRSNPDASAPQCKTKLGPQSTIYSGTDHPALGQYNGYYLDKGARQGSWMPLGFSDNYLSGHLGDPAGTRTLNTTTIAAGNLGYQVECMNHVDQNHMTGYPWNTHLAAPLKEAANLLLKVKTSNLQALSDTRGLRPELKDIPVKRWIIFETDGQPTDTMGNNSKPYKDTTPALTTQQKLDSVKVGNLIEPTAPGDAMKGCQDLVNVATSAKAAGIGIIMIAYGAATTATCGSLQVRDQMAAAASNAPNGSPSLASKCENASSVALENGDKDYFFCAATGADLKEVFKTVIGMTSSSNTKFVKMPK